MRIDDMRKKYTTVVIHTFEECLRRVGRGLEETREGL